MEIDLDALRAAARAVSTELEEHRQALTEMVIVESEFLELAIDAARPALPAVCSRIVRSSEPDEPEVSYFDTTGIVIAERLGKRLVLCEDGSLGCATDALGPGEPGVHRVWRPMTPTDAMMEFDLADCVDGIRSAIDKQKGKRRNATMRVRKQIEDLRALKARLEHPTPEVKKSQK